MTFLVNAVSSTYNFVKRKIETATPLFTKITKAAITGFTAYGLYYYYTFENCTTSKDWLFRDVTHCQPTFSITTFFTEFINENFALLAVGMNILFYLKEIAQRLQQLKEELSAGALQHQAIQQQVMQITDFVNQQAEQLQQLQQQVQQLQPQLPPPPWNAA